MIARVVACGLRHGLDLSVAESGNCHGSMADMMVCTENWRWLEQSVSCVGRQLLNPVELTVVA